MTPSKSLYISLLSLLSYTRLYAQTGAGCYETTCPTPGQVRIDAVFDMWGNFLGGCNCGCDRNMAPCPAGKVVNFDPMTMTGDCSCVCPNGAVGGECNGNPGTKVLPDCSCDTSRIVCAGNQVIVDPSAGQCGCANECQLPFIQNSMTCECEHSSTNPNAPGGPSAMEPATPGSAGTSMVVYPEVLTCKDPICECSGNAACTIRCDSPDSCKDATLICANNYDCSVICLDNACNKASIVGPDKNDFNVYCEGLSSCVDAKMQAELARHTSYHCAGKDSCKGAGTSVTCGIGLCETLFTGDSSGMDANIEVGFAVGFSCVGRYADCPNNFDPPCAGLGACPCSAEQCFAQRDIFDGCKCKCPETLLAKEAAGDIVGICGADRPGHIFDKNECACDCPYGSLPQGGCLPSQDWNSRECRCECPNNPTGECPGYYEFDPVSCDCVCPAHSPSPRLCAAMGRVWRDCSCQCETPCPGAGQVQSFGTCACACPWNTPKESDCVNGLDLLTCQCKSNNCCRTSVAGYKPWRGLCWDETSENACLAEPNMRCEWEPNNCLPAVPVNELNPNKACAFANQVCVTDSDCCSERCKVTGVCQ